MMLFNSIKTTLNFKLSNFKLKASLIVFLMFFGLLGKSQDGTRNNTSESSTPTGKIMLIPFEPKMYMSNIDQKINQQTGWKFDRIRENFRKQLDNLLKAKLSSQGKVVSFYSDSASMAKDLGFIYKATGLTYDLVDKPLSPGTTSTAKNIKNGQLTVEMNADKKFMNRKINDPELITYLYKKYKTEYFVFINELDITTNPDAYDLATDSYQRDVIVHYSIIDKTSKTLAAGIAASKFSSKENNPKKIASLNFTTIATQISTTIEKLISPPAQKQK